MRTGFKKCRRYGQPLDREISVIHGESMTRQDMADAVNINAIYAKTQRGEIVLASDTMPEYGDFSQIESYDVALEKIMDAENAFFDLPASVRKLYGNSPETYYEKMLEKAQGLFDAEEEEKRVQQQKVERSKKVEEAKQLLKEEDQESS